MDADHLNGRAAAELVAATGLGPAKPAQPLSASDWSHLRALAQSDRLAGLLVEAIGQGIIEVEGDQEQSAAELEEAWQRHVLAAERLLLKILSSFDQAGITYRVFKGAALAHVVYPDPSQRVFGDLDLLIPGAQLAEARQHLVTHFDGDDIFPEVRPGFDAEFAKDVLVRVEGIEIDLHRTLAAGPFGMRIPVAQLFHNPATFTLAGQHIQTMAPVPTFLQVCYNAALGDVPPRLLSLRDVAQVQQHYELTLSDVQRTAQAWGAEAVVSYAVATAWKTLNVAPCELSEWAQSYSAGPLDARLLAASVSEKRSYTRALAMLFAMDGVSQRVRYLRGILAPSPEYLATRGWTRGSHVKRALNRLKPSR